MIDYFLITAHPQIFHSLFIIRTVEAEELAEKMFLSLLDIKGRLNFYCIFMLPNCSNKKKKKTVKSIRLNANLKTY